MERFSNHESGPSQEKVATTFERQLKLFESRKEGERFKEVPDAIFAFAEFIREESEKVMESVRALDNYYLEKEAAKLHKFNMDNAAVLHGFAEQLGLHPENIDLLVSTFPWLREMQAWAEDYVTRED